ncbi:MAG: hypothetical protein WCG01_02765 [bacterium]
MKLCKGASVTTGLFLILAVFFLQVSQVLAAGALKVSPIRVDELANPGDVISRSVTVTNDSDTPTTIFAYIRDFKSEGEEGQARLIEPGSESGPYLSSWIQITNAGVSFAPHEARDFSFKVSVPQNAGPGGYYGALVFGTKAPNVRIDSAEKGAAIGVAQQTAVLVLIQIAGQVNESAIIRDFSTDKSLYNTPFTATFLTRIENQGNVHIKPRGIVQVYNMMGKEVSNIRINDKSANVLPKTIRKFQDNWQDNFGFGRYKAVLSLSYGTSLENGGTGMQSLNSISYFWILPFKIVGIILLILAGIFLFIFSSFKMFKMRAMKNMMKELGVGGANVKRRKSKNADGSLGLVLFIVLSFIALLGLAVFFLVS